MGQNSNLPNVALVSLEVIVNTGDLRQTDDELTERCVTHPTTVDVMATPEFVSSLTGLYMTNQTLSYASPWLEKQCRFTEILFEKPKYIQFCSVD